MPASMRAELAPTDDSWLRIGRAGVDLGCESPELKMVASRRVTGLKGACRWTDGEPRAAETGTGELQTAT